MKIDSYSIVHSGLSDIPEYVAALSDKQNLLAVSSGNRKGASDLVIKSIKNIDLRVPSLIASELETCFEKFHDIFHDADTQVTTAGAIIDGENLYFFNSGNARSFLFSNGYMISHTDDHTVAYDEYRALFYDDMAAYDEMRYKKSRLELTRYLGDAGDCRPQFYPPIRLEKNHALLICTERFWRYLNTTEMELDYRKAAGPEEWLKIMSRRVLMRANRELDEDNFAAVAAMVEDV